MLLEEKFSNSFLCRGGRHGDNFSGWFLNVYISLSFTGDRSHVIEQSMNRRTGEEERKQDFINLDESECFDAVLNDTLYKFVNFLFLFLGPMSIGGGPVEMILGLAHVCDSYRLPKGQTFLKADFLCTLIHVWHLNHHWMYTPDL